MTLLHVRGFQINIEKALLHIQTSAIYLAILKWESADISYQVSSLEKSTKATGRRHHGDIMQTVHKNNLSNIFGN